MIDIQVVEYCGFEIADVLRQIIVFMCVYRMLIVYELKTKGKQNNKIVSFYNRNTSFTRHYRTHKKMYKSKSQKKKKKKKKNKKKET